MSMIVVVQGMQYGSEAKGQIAGMIADQWRPETVACANHPNAGHTYSDPTGSKFIHRILPVGAVVPSVRNILIGPGAVIDSAALRQEINLLDSTMDLSLKTLVIHPRAVIVTEQHREDEKKLVRVGSTMKGSMEAVVQKMRRPSPMGSNLVAFNLDVFDGLRVQTVISANHYDWVMDTSKKVLIEGAQGYSLGIHGQFYPYCTSRDVSTHQVLADCRVPYGRDVYVHGVMRTFPIRVANRFDENGVQIGTSGPCYPDQRELDWGVDLGREPELTTVTKLPRRIFSLSMMQVAEAAQCMGVNGISLSFCDYLKSTTLDQLIHDVKWALGGATPIVSRSYGPKYGHVMNSMGDGHMDFGKHIDIWFDKRG